MDPKFYSLLGLAVRAGKVSFGHDAAKKNIRRGHAAILLFASDASSRLREEMKGLDARLPVVELPLDSLCLAARFGKKAAVLTVNDRGFARGLCQSPGPAENKEETRCL